MIGWFAAAGDAQEDEAEVERLLQQVADARHAGDRRDAMSQLSSLLQGNPRVGTWLNCNTPTAVQLSTMYLTPTACCLDLNCTLHLRVHR
jgi:hypothetical protein